MKTFHIYRDDVRGETFVELNSTVGGEAYKACRLSAEHGVDDIVWVLGAMESLLYWERHRIEQAATKGK